MKRIISSVLIISLLLYLQGCYTFNEVTKDEFREKASTGSTVILTRDLETYKFDKLMYFVKDDTLTGNGLKLNGNEQIPFSGKISLENISVFSLEEFNGTETFLLIVGIVVIGVVLVGLLLVKAITDEFTE